MEPGTLLVLSQRMGDDLDTTTSTGIGLGLSLVFGLIGLALFAFHIYVLVDILKHSDGAWTASGQNKTLWIVLWVVTLCCGVAPILDLIYWFAIRPKLTAAGGAGGGYTGYAQ